MRQILIGSRDDSLASCSWKFQLEVEPPSQLGVFSSPRPATTSCSDANATGRLQTLANSEEEINATFG